MAMASKSGNRISVNEEEALGTLRQVRAAHASPGLPTAASVIVQGPPDVSVVTSFNTSMDIYAQGMKFRIESLRADLEMLHESIKQTVTQFAAHDASVSDEANAMLASCESVATPTSSGTTPSASTSSIG